MAIMNFEEYQRLSKKSAIYPSLGVSDGPFVGWIYPSLGLAGETGEVVENIKKLIRDNRLALDDEFREKIKKELGDILWYVSQLASELSLSLADIAKSNLDKVESRRARGLLHGRGDER